MDYGLISIIVPIYNVSKYLDKCVESILNQNYKNIELILVDDGSTDGSKKKCDDWAQKDTRVVVIHKENGGSADSRNVGMEAAKGDYIGFVDSDDWIAPEMYEKLMDAIQERNLDMSVCFFKAVSDENYEFNNTEYPTTEYTGRDFANLIIAEKKPRISYAIWKCLYKREVIKDIKFYKGVHYNEDAVFLIESLWNAKKMAFIDAPMYYYRVHGSSISNIDISEKRIKDILFKCQWLLNYYEKNANDSEIKKVRKCVINELLSYLRLASKQKSLNKCEVLIKKYINDNKLGVKDIRFDIKNLLKYIFFVL
ncbi:MAG: glycosyltransferase [Pseudobutyrivibrio ruminis]|nr:glycosyltransferase [Pseudobutyrivibrio ruminis]